MRAERTWCWQTATCGSGECWAAKEQSRRAHSSLLNNPADEDEDERLFLGDTTRCCGGKRRLSPIVNRLSFLGHQERGCRQAGPLILQQNVYCPAKTFLSVNRKELPEFMFAVYRIMNVDENKTNRQQKTCDGSAAAGRFTAGPESRELRLEEMREESCSNSSTRRHGTGRDCAIQDRFVNDQSHIDLGGGAEEAEGNETGIENKQIALHNSSARPPERIGCELTRLHLSTCRFLSYIYPVFNSPTDSRETAPGQV